MVVLSEEADLVEGLNVTLHFGLDGKDLLEDAAGRLSCCMLVLLFSMNFLRLRFSSPTSKSGLLSSVVVLKSVKGSESEISRILLDIDLAG